MCIQLKFELQQKETPWKIIIIIKLTFKLTLGLTVILYVNALFIHRDMGAFHVFRCVKNLLICMHKYFNLYNNNKNTYKSLV